MAGRAVVLLCGFGCVTHFSFLFAIVRKDAGITDPGSAFKIY